MPIQPLRKFELIMIMPYCFRQVKLLSVLWLALSGCHPAALCGPGDESLVVGLEGNPTTLDPRVARDAYSTRLLPLLFHFLVQLDADGRILPDLAQTWEQPDPGTVIFHLRPGLRFSTGREVTAEDVVWTLQSLADPELRSARLSLAQRLEQIQALDAYTVRIRLREPYAPLFTELALGIVPREEAGRRGKDFGRHPVGSGPYQLRSWEQGGELVLEPNPFFFGPAPRIPRLVFRVVPDDVTRVMSLLRGEVHLLLNSVPPDDLPALEQNPRLQVQSAPGVNYTYLAFNLRDPILQSREVRQAIAHAIPRQELADCFFRGQMRPATGILAPGHWAYTAAVETYEYNPELAETLLDRAGFPRPAPGAPRFHLRYKTSQNKLRRGMAEAIAYALGQVGIEVEVLSLEFGTLFADIQAGNFQLFSLTWVGVTEPDIYYTAFHSSSIPPAGANRGYYSNLELDRLAERGRRTFDPDERRAVYHRAQQIIAHDLPYVSLFYSTDTVVSDRRLQGFQLFPEGDFRSLASADWSTP